MSPVWAKGPRERVENIRVGKSFLSIDGEVFTVARHESQLTYVTDAKGASTLFANCAEGVIQ